MWWSTPSYTLIAQSKQASRTAELARWSDKLFPSSSSESRSTSAADYLILSSSASALAEGIAGQRWTSVEVLEAFVRRAIQVQEKSNCLTELLFEDALKRAEELDKVLKETGIVVGPLHGVPVSLKDQYGVQGHDTTIGFTTDVGQPAQEDAEIVAILRAAGAVPFVKTNVPQTMLSFECSNTLFGKTTNPYGDSRTPGGSSGGEGCLLGSDGSPLGMGSDVGGSLRIPAHYSGCYGFKGTHSRFPDGGARSPSAGFEGIRSTLGPMGRCVDDLILATRTIFSSTAALQKYSNLIPVRYREVELPSKLKLGYYFDDGFCRSSPACARAVSETVEALRQQGHELIEIAPPEPLEAMEIFVGLTSADGYQTLLSNLRGDPQEPAMFLTTLGVKLPWFVRNFAVWLLGYVDPCMARLVAASRPKTVREQMTWVARRNKFVKEQRKELWSNLGLDGVIAPPQAVPALPCGATWNLSPLSIATIVYNVIDSCVGVLPVTFVDPVRDMLPEGWMDKEGGSPIIQGRLYGPDGLYDPEKMAGLPVGVQLVAPHWEEEKCLAMMKVVESALGDRGFGPGAFRKRQLKTE